MQARLHGGALSHHSTRAKIILYHETQLARWLFGGFWNRGNFSDLGDKKIKAEFKKIIPHLIPKYLITYYHG